VAAPDVELLVGTCGWSYPDWVGPFYTPGTRSGEMLERYARVFDTVEVNSTFYAVPPRERVEGWDRATPEGFRFSVKVPRALTHEARLGTEGEGGEALSAFVDALAPLGDKLDRVLVQLPPSLSAREGLPRAEALFDADALPVPAVLEARHPSWGRQRVVEALAGRRVTWAWSENQHWTSPPAVTTRDAYLRLIGDRELDNLDRVQRDPEPAIDRWLARLADREDELDRARVYANNHFAGFGPGTVNALLRRAGREPRSWRDPGGQATLGDFGDA
jgi:uncharacterized protein YecE (DUF72 family)